MKRTVLAVVTAIIACIHCTTTPVTIVAGSAVVVGCAAFQRVTPLEQVVLARDAYTRVLRTLTLYRKAERISDEHYAEIETHRKVAATALDAMEEAALSGETDGWSSLTTAFNTALDALLEWELRTERATP